jgi:antirestriction protein ArdC
MPNAPALNHGGALAFYRPATDTVQMPTRETFDNPEAYYSTLFHELTHSTGHQKRLNRPTLTDLQPFGSTNYSKEELVAELGAAFLCAQAGIENATVNRNASYIAGWLRALENDRRMVILAAAQAQKAADYILGRMAEPEAEAERMAA